MFTEHGYQTKKSEDAVDCTESKITVSTFSKEYYIPFAIPVLNNLTKNYLVFSIKTPQIMMGLEIGTFFLKILKNFSSQNHNIQNVHCTISTT